MRKCLPIATVDQPTPRLTPRFVSPQRWTRERGHVGEDAVRDVRQAGYTDAQVIEIVAHVALNTFTNYLNESLKTDIDFPAVSARAAA